MSLVHVANACSHLQNASAARLGLTSLPCTTMLHTLLLSMQRSGFIGSVTVGGPKPSPPTALSPVLDPFYFDRPDSPSSSSSSPSTTSPLIHTPQITQENVASRRLWIGLKYYRNEPVLRKMQCISKPKRRFWLGVKQLEALARGDQQGYVQGLRGVGESMFVTTDRGIMELRECVERRSGGMLLCRVNPAF